MAGIVAFYRNPSLRTVTNYFVLSLSFTDLSMAFSAMLPSTVVTITTDGIPNNSTSCELVYFIGSGLAGISLLMVMLLAVNRYFRVVRPALYPSIFFKKRSVAMAVCAWVVTIAQFTVVFFATTKQRQNFTTIESVVSCIQFVQTTVSSKLHFVTSVIYIVVPSLIIVACYIKIYQTIRQHNNAAAPSSEGVHSSYGVEEAKITRMLTVAVVGFYLCWLPLLLCNTLLSLDLLGENAFKYQNFYHTFPLFASSATNPMVYGTMSQSFRNEFLKILRRQP